MGAIKFADVKKTLFFFMRNGFKSTCYEIQEKLEMRKQPLYRWELASLEELKRQKRWAEQNDDPLKFSIVVPAYRTRENCLRELLDSLMFQSYPYWELILADATEGKRKKILKVLQEFDDPRIRYVHLESNGGISENTNRALELATGDYVGLLDHDDTLTRDALYEVAVRIEEKRREGVEPQLLYSDEDKAESNMLIYHEPNRKEAFNLDLLLSNNYICHFMVMKRGLIRKLKLRKEFDGAQDHDLVLRAVDELEGREDTILHVPKTIYHWRCYGNSTSENPWSKRYAYDAGRRAVQAFVDRRGWKAKVTEMPHPGFYRLEYGESPLKVRDDLAAVGGRLTENGKVTGGRMGADGSVFYEGLPEVYSGYLHRAILQQDAEALDVRNLEVRESLRGLFEEITGVPYKALPGTEKFDAATLPAGADPVEISLRLSKALRDGGYRLLYQPLEV
ncbi:MAG: glycosyltransferase [Firmicutes bacterium]|nr:glycosyltransferase [Bacillota bacterium]